MFCSSCKRLEFMCDDTRKKICVNGHVVCKSCDRGGLHCTICEGKIENFIHITVDDQAPRLLITPILPSHASSLPSSSPSATSLSSNDTHNSLSVSTIDRIMQQLNKCENDTKQMQNQPIVGCFQVIGCKKDQVAYTLSLDEHSSCVEVTKISEVFASRRSALSFTTRSECSEAASTTSTAHSCDSVYEFYSNPLPISYSETEDSESLAEHQLPETPFFAHRVKLTPLCQHHETIPPQMEPLEPLECFPQATASAEVVGRVSRMPLMCPITTCKIISTPSDFCNHIFIDHPYIECVKTPPGRVVNFRINLAENVNVVRCHRMFLLSGKKINTSSLHYKKCVPILLLTTKINRKSLFTNSSGAASDEVTLMWLSSVYSHPINFALTLWRHGNEPCIRSISTVTSSMSDFKPGNRLRRGSLVLSHGEIERLKTERGNSLLCQVVFG